jgi:eukaryotic-like serine/threonine-protein kinase
MAIAAENPVGAAWAGLGALVFAVGVLIAVRGPVFPVVPKADTAGAAEVGMGRAEGGDPERGSTPDPSPSSSGKPAVKPVPWSIPGIVPGAPEPEPPAVPSPEQREATKLFMDRVRKNDLKGSVNALEDLATKYPWALKDRDVKEQVVELSQRVTALQTDDPDRMFAVLAHKSGSVGIDILYYLATSKGGSRASKMAEEYLRDPKVVGRGSEAMKVAWELRQAKCDDKKALFARAGEHGDVRSLGQLQLLNRRCGRRNRGCCYENDKELDAAMEKFKDRGLR